MAMNKARRTANLNNILTYDTLGNSTLIANLTVEGLTNAGFVKADVNGLLSVDINAYITLNSGLTGFTVGDATAISAADTVLQAFGKIQGQLNAIPDVNVITGTGAAGQVSYWNGTSTQAGSANLVWDNTNGRLGIGTNAPARVLSVTSATNGNAVRIEVPATNTAVYDFYLGNAADANYIRYNASIVEFRRAGAASTIRTVGGSSNDLALQADGSLTFFTNGANERMRVFNATGNLLIQNGGTFTDSGQRLQVTGNSIINGNLTVNNGVSGDAITIANDGFLKFALTRLRGFASAFQFQDNLFSTKIFLSMNTGVSWFNTGGNYHFGGTSDSGQRLQVTGDTLLKGSGNTSGTTALIVENSDGTDSFRVRNDSSIIFGNASTVNIYPTVDGITINNASSSPALVGGTGGYPSIFLGRQTAVTNTFAGTQELVRVIGNFTPTSGSHNFEQLRLQSTINQTGGANGITRGLYVNPTLTAAADWRSIEWSNNSGWGLYGEGSASNYLAGKLGIGTTTLTANTLRITRVQTGATSINTVLSSGQINSDVTSSVNNFASQLITQAATFTLGQFSHFRASDTVQGAGSTITNNIGFRVDDLTFGTNDFGFYGDLSSGDNKWNLYMNGSANNFMAGSLGIGSVFITDSALRVAKNMTGGATYNGIYNDGTIQSDVTTSAIYFRTQARTAASVVTSNIVHYYAQSLSLGAGSTVTNQFGFHAENNLIGATNNYGFYGNIAAATGRWNLYMVGTALNYFNGNTLIGSTTDSGEKLQVTGTAKITGNLKFGSEDTLIFATANGSTQSVAGRGVIISTNAASQSGVGALKVVGNYTSAISNDYGIWISNTFTNGTGGVATHSGLLLNQTINQTGGANGITRGLFINPTLTAAADWRSVEWSNNSGWGIYGTGTATNYWAGKTIFGGNPSSTIGSASFTVNNNITGSTSQFGIWQNGTVQSDVTNTVWAILNRLNTQATAFTLTNYNHFAALQNVIGAGSAVTNQFGFLADSTLTGATFNYGFYGNIAAATNRWNLYMNGTASNYINGNLLIGSATDTTEKLQVTGSTRLAGQVRVGTATSHAIGFYGASPVTKQTGNILTALSTIGLITAPTIAVGDVTGAVSALTGEVSTTGTGSLTVTLGTTAVTGKLLTGLSVTSGSITASDSILAAFGKIQGQINGLAGGSTYKGSWNASTNTPTITSGTGTSGDYYIVSTAGTTTIDGVSSWDIGDWIIFNGTVWQKIDNTDSVTSVNGLTGAITLTTSNITEGTNLYYTDTRARGAITLTTTGSSGAATYTSGVFNIPNYTLSGLGGVSSATTITINGTEFDLTTSRSWSVGTVTSITAGTYLTGGTITGTGTIAVDATTTNTASKVVARDGSGNFAAGTITAALSGNASTATTWQTARTLTIGSTGKSVDGSANVSWSLAEIGAQQAITLTTTGSSGAATLSSGTLNIPQYQAVLTNPITGTGSVNFIPKFSSSTGLTSSIISETGGIATINGAGQVYTQQAGAGGATIFISNNDTTAAVNHQTRIVTQNLGSGVGRTIIQAASHTTNTNRGQFGILNEEGSSFIMQLGQQVTTTDYSMSLYTTSGLEQIRLNTNGNTYFTGGNVGIGINSPNHKLDIVSTNKTLITDLGSAINVDYGGTNANQFQTIGFTWSSSTGNPNTYWGIGFRGTNYSSGTGDVFLYSAGVERLTVAQSGFVGIGTNSPASRLDVNGDIAVRANSSTLKLYGTDHSYVEFYPITAAGRKGYFGFGSANTTTLSFVNESTNGHTVLLTNGTGNVGVNTLSPLATLHVNGTFISSYLWTDVLGNSFWGSYSTKYGGLTWEAGYARVFSHDGNALYLGAGGILATHLSIATTGQIKFNNYTTSTSFSGTIAGLLAFDSTGNVITTNLSGLGGVPTSRTLTINGTTLDLTANRSWSVGTVTSVNASVPTGFSVGSAVTSSGNIAISFAAGYSLPTTASQTNWDAAYNDKINSASVTGTTTKTLTLTQQDGGTVTASWSDIDTAPVASVFGRTGAVVAASGDYTTAQVTESGNLYYTDARARAAITLSTTGTSGPASYSAGVLNIPQYQAALTNPITNSGVGAFGYFPKFTGNNSINNSNLFESGTSLFYGGGSAAEYSLQIGSGRTGNGFAYIDLIGDTTNTDYGLRLMRSNGGANTTSAIEHMGTGDFIFKAVESANIKLQTGSTDRMIIDSTGRVGINIAPSYTFQVQGTGYFSDNVRFPNNKGIVFAQTGGSILGSISMSINNAVTISNNSLLGVMVYDDQVMLSGKVGIGHAGNIYGGASTALSMANSLTTPSSSFADSFIMYSSDVTAGNAAPHFRTENGAVVKLYQETTSVGNSIFSQGGGNNVLDDSTFDGYTLRQVVKALRNQGILQ